MPNLHSRVTNKTYHEILDRVDTRLSGWNAKHLSFAERLTLAQAVIQALPIYSVQTTKIPRATQGKIDCIYHRFIQSRNGERNSKSMVRWDSISQPKIKGGLGLKNPSQLNEALLMKIGWDIIVSPTSLWTKVLCSKYGVENDNFPTQNMALMSGVQWVRFGNKF